MSSLDISGHDRFEMRSVTSLLGTRQSFQDRSRRHSRQSARLVGFVLTALLAAFFLIDLANAGTSADPSLASLQSPDTRALEFPSASLRKSLAETLLGDCKVALTRVPRQTSAEGLTEERPGDITE